MKQLRFSRSTIINRHSQRGDFLIESLIGVLLIGIVGVGIAHTARQVTKTQIQSQQQAQIISKLKGIASGGLESAICGNANSLNLAAGEYSHGLSYKNTSSCEAGAIKTLRFNIAGKEVETKQPLVLEVAISENSGEKILRVGQITN